MEIDHAYACYATKGRWLFLSRTSSLDSLQKKKKIVEECVALAVA
jgi:hypothetical protein